MGKKSRLNLFLNDIALERHYIIPGEAKLFLDVVGQNSVDVISRILPKL